MSDESSSIVGTLGSAIRLQGARLRRAVDQVHRAERGATLTEFIIILPVFLIIFSAILKLTLLQSTTVQLKISVTKDLWNRTLQAQHTGANTGRYLNAQTAAGASITDVRAAETDRSFSDQFDEDKFEGLRPNGTSSGGTIGESEAALSAGGNELTNTAQLQLPPSAGSGATASTGEVLQRNNHNYDTGGGNTMYSAQLVNDAAYGNSPPNLPAPLNQMALSPSPGNNESNAAYAAGIRYGLVKAEASAADSPNAAQALDQIPFINAGNLTAGYDTLIAPYPIVDRGSSATDHYRPVGMARRFMEDNYHFEDYSGIDFETP